MKSYVELNGFESPFQESLSNTSVEIVANENIRRVLEIWMMTSVRPIVEEKFAKNIIGNIAGLLAANFCDQCPNLR